MVRGETNTPALYVKINLANSCTALVITLLLFCVQINTFMVHALASILYTKLVSNQPDGIIIIIISVYFVVMCFVLLE